MWGQFKSKEVLITLLSLNTRNSNGSGVRSARTVHEGSNLHSINLRSFGSTRTKHQLDQSEPRQWTKEILVCGERDRWTAGMIQEYLTVLHIMVSVNLITKQFMWMLLVSIWQMHWKNFNYSAKRRCTFHLFFAF